MDTAHPQPPVDDIEIGERKDYNVKLKYVDELSDHYFHALGLSSELIITETSVRERIYDQFHKTMVVLIGLLAASEKYKDWATADKRREVMRLSASYDKEAWLKMDDMLMEIADMLADKKLMDERTKRVSTRDMFK